MPPVLVLLAKTAKQAIPRVKIVAARAVSARWADWATPRPAVEPFAFVITLLLYVWWVAPASPHRTDVILRTLLGLTPLVSILAHRDRPRALGFTLHNLGASASEVGLATAAFTLVVLLIGAATGHRITLPREVRPSQAALLFWPLWQQFTLQGFVCRRLAQGGRSPHHAAAAAALLFGAAHWPNPLLVVFTTLAGYVWCRLYQRAPNLFTLTLAHGWLAACVGAALPHEWMHGLRVGPGFWE